MSGLYGNVGGTARKASKLYGNVSGANRKLKSLWAKVGGVGRKIFSGAVTWTYVFQKKLSNFWLGGGAYKGIALSLSDSDGTDETLWSEAVYTFTEPLQVKSGDVISLTGEMEHDGSNLYTVDDCSINVYLNGSDSSTLHFSKEHNNSGDTINYVLSNRTITSIRVRAEMYVSRLADDDYFSVHGTVTLNVGGQSFYLGQSGTSENQ